LRDDLLLKFTREPELADQDKFVAGLSSTRTDVVQASMTVLLKMPRDERALVPAMRLLRRMAGEPKSSAVRAEILSLVSYESGQAFKIQEPAAADTSAVKSLYRPVFDWFGTRYPALVRQLDAETEENPAKWTFLLKSVPWTRGEPERGADIFRERGCQTCHATSTPLGPNLGGVASRLSLQDLFEAIIYPSREVAAPYRVEMFQTRDGASYSGIVAFESADGVILRTGAATTLRLAESDIASRQPSNYSLMPNGLLEGLKAQELADLYSFLKTLDTKGK
jgi:putative heme-binding domain-containing protein